MEENMMLILEYVVRILIIVGGGFVVKFVKDKINENQLEQFKGWTIIAVKAAEMIYQEKGTGQLKKEYVVDFLQEKLNDWFFFELSADQLDTLIEAVVYELKRLN